MAEKGNRLKWFEVSETKFKANGNTYIRDLEPTIDRMKALQIKGVELQYGAVVASLFDHLEKVYENMNNGKQADAAVGLYKVLQRKDYIKADLDKIKFTKDDPFVRYCGIFMNKEGEDRKFITEAMIDEKIEDWIKEGIPWQYFFVNALNTSPSLKNTFLKNFPTSSEQKQTQGKNDQND